MNVESRAQDEVAERGDPDFAGVGCVVVGVTDNIGDQLAKAGFCTESQAKEAGEC